MGEEMSFKEKESQASQWALGARESDVSNLSQLSDSHPFPFGLQFVPTDLVDLQRPLVKASTEELFCFFRLYVTTIAKSQILTLLDGGINWFFWYHIQNLIFNSLPHVFVQVFIAAYAPEEHFYIDKMNPMLTGYNFIVIFAAFFELMRFTSSLLLLMDYVWHGLSMKNPWNSCLPIYNYTMKNTQDQVKCIDILDFPKKVQDSLALNNTIRFFANEYYIKTPAGVITEYFQIPHMTHFKTRREVRLLPFKDTPFALYFVIMWGFAALHYNQFYKKLIWKLLKYSNYTELGINIIITLHIFLSYYVTNPELLKVDRIGVEKDIPGANDLDIDVISLALNAPPVIHVLISRSTDDHSKIQCKSYSALMVISSWIYNFANGIMFKYLKVYCESLVGIRLHQSHTNAFGFFYIYAIYYSYFLLGNIFFTITLIVKCTSDFYVFLITYYCLVETVVNEWKFITRIMILSFITLMALLNFLLNNDSGIIIVYIYSKSCVILIEVVGIYLLYPLGRLIEDIIFQTGKEPHLLHKWCLMCVPVFKIYKMYEWLMLLYDLREHFKWCWFLPVVLLVGGIIYTMLLVLYVQKRSWLCLFCPIPEWGPVDFHKRKCRKMYKKHEYIGSQADRQLSRYMLGRDEMDMVRLDLRYDIGRRSTNAQYVPYFNYESDKKTT